MKRGWGIFLIIVIIIGGGIAGIYFWWNQDTAERDPFSLIPEDAIYIIQTNEAVAGWNTISDSEMWQHLLGTKTFEDIHDDASLLDSLIGNNETLEFLIGERQMLVSAHMISKKDFDFLFAIDLKKASKITFLTDYIGRLVEEFGFTKRDETIMDSKVMSLQDKESLEDLYISFVDNIMLCTYSRQILENALADKDTNYWAHEPAFTEVSEEISRRSLLKFYINYQVLNNYLNVYLDKSSENMADLCKSMEFSAFAMDIDKEDLLLEGYTNLDDSISSYMKALLMTDPGRTGAETVIPDNAALYISMAFDNSEDFFSNLEEVLANEDTSGYENFSKNKSRLEKFFKVDLDEDFFSWIGNEIAFVKTQPKANAREKDVSVFLHASDIEAAKTGLGHLTKQVKKRSPVKFETIEYQNNEIHYLNIKGFFRLFFGKLFKEIERPYFTYIEDYVVFSNSPSELMDIIDDYTRGATLERKEEFMNFKSSFASKANVNAFVQMPKVYSHMYQYANAKNRKGLQKEKDVILSFAYVGFQLVSKGDYFKAQLMARHNPDILFDEELEKLETAAEDVFTREYETLEFKVPDSMLLEVADGPYKGLMPESTISIEGRVEGGKASGLWRSFYESGNIKCAVNYKEGMVDGVALFYYDMEEQTMKSEAKFSEDMMEGVYREYYENGARKAMIEYSNGKPHGIAEYYYDSGLIKVEGKYKKGQKKGKWKHFLESGEIFDKEKWKKGQKK